MVAVRHMLGIPDTRQVVGMPDKLDMNEQTWCDR